MRKITDIIVIAGLSSLLCACGSNKPAENQNAEQSVANVVAKVKVAAVCAEEVPLNAEYPTSVRANAVNNIAPQSGGRIQKLNVEVGDFVSAGSVLAEMDRVQLDQAELKLKNSETDLERVRQLLSEGGISQADFEQMELACKVSRSAYENLLENTILRSPVSGVVTARNYDKGDMYTMAQPLYTVQQITPVKLLIGVSEADYTRVKKGQNAVITADAFPGKTFTGRVNRLYPVMDATTHTFNVEVLVQNSGRELRPGMYAKVTVDFGSRHNITVPDLAVVKQQGSGQRSVVVLNEDNTVSFKVVEVGRHFDSKYEILSGLSEGETIVVKGQNTLKNGETVEVI
ncbi:MAG: efflux RND transporter periplasmic adaptor subunit [Bacteroidales bacterium]|nr:efflux RND transporter periplasmic adaptor subunit [Bacteroidales bacterium]